jgi:hypothetical protein
MLIFLKQKLKCRKGSSSILILFMMILLIVLGTFTFSSSNINYRFSRKASDWTKNYYSLDYMAETYIMKVDRKLIIAEQKAIEYMVNLGFTYQAYDGVSNEVQTMINNMATNSSSVDATNNIIANKIYMYYVYVGLLELSYQYPNNIVLPLITNGLIESVATEVNFTLEDFGDSIINETFNLRVNLSVMPFRYTVNQNANEITLTLANLGKRYRVNSWQQWNTPIYTDVIIQEQLE